MAIDALPSTPVKNMCDDAKNDARLNVLYSPFRKKEVNPQDWESKMVFWKNNIQSFCIDNHKCVFSLSNLQSIFVRNGRPAACLAAVVEDMVKNNEIIRFEDLLSRDPSVQTWSSWAVNCFVKTPLIWSLSKLKESLVTKPEINVEEKYVHIAELKRHSENFRQSFKSKSGKLLWTLEEVKEMLHVKDELSVKAVLHWLQLQGQASVITVNNQALIKVSTDNTKVRLVTEADLGVYRLEQNLQALIHTLEQLETEKQAAEQEARSYLKKGMRQVAKSCLRKKKELDKCIIKRGAALDNVQVLLSRVKEAESDAEILDSYRMGLSALKATYKDAGLSEDGVFNTMDQVKEVLEVHEEIQNALSEPVAAGLDADLEQELAALLSASSTQPVDHTDIRDVSFDLPEPPTHSPSTTSTKVLPKAAQQIPQ